jgi:excisionase family DNA binding protein
MPKPYSSVVAGPGLLSVEEFADALGWSSATVRAKVLRREVEYIKLGRSVRFRPETVSQLIEQNTIPALVRR